MSDNLNQAVALLNDLLELGRTTSSSVDQATLDRVVDQLAPVALEDVDRFTVQLAADAQTAADAEADAEAAAARHAVEEAERAAQADVQEEEDQAQRDERHAAGVS